MNNTQVLTNIEKIIKNDYLPAWQNMINTEPSAFLSKVKKVKLTSDKIKAGAPFGLSGGFGYGAEGQATPKAGAQVYEGFEVKSKDMYVNVEISEKAVELGGTAGSIVGLLDAEIKAAYEAAKWNVGRSLFGNGTGILAKEVGGFPPSNVDFTEITVDETRYLKEGLTVDIIDVGDGSVAVKTGTGRIKNIDRANKKITFHEPITSKGAFGTVYVTVQNSYNREITGIGAIMDLTSTGTKLYGVDKSENGAIVPTHLPSVGAINDSIIRSGLRTALRDKNGKIDTILCGDTAFDAYVEYLRANNIRVEDSSKEIEGGFKAIKFLFDNREVDIVNEQFVPADEMWGVDTTAFEFHCLDWDFAQLKDGGIFNLMENTSSYRALLRNYGNLICSNPGGCLRISGITAAPEV